MKEKTADIEHLNTQVKELKQKLSELENKNAFTNAILEGGSVIIWAVNNDMELITFNQNYFNFFLQKDEAGKIGHEAHGIIKNINAEAFWKKKYGQSLRGVSSNFDIRIESKGEKRWKEVYLTPIYDTRGNITGVSGLAHDITDKMKSKIDLIKSEEKFRNIFESFQDLYIRCDFNGKLTMLSPSVVDIIGYTEHELLGKYVTNYYCRNIKNKALLRKLLKKKSIKNFEAGLVHKSGQVINCICNIRIIYDNHDKPQYVECVVRDITELKKTTEELHQSKELAERSLKIKERFLANMSHEIRTPLNGIMGMLHLLDETSLNSKQRNHVKALKSSSEILLNILNDLLDIAKIEAGKMRVKNAPVNTRDVLNKLSLLYKPQATDKQLEMLFELGDEVPQHVNTDETKIIQVYSNLISNAIKFTPAGGSVCIGLYLKKKKKNAKLILKGIVEDSGIGIRESDQKKLFSSFTQLDSSSSKVYEGTGLGLHISKKIVKLLKGNIRARSQIDKGSIFRFTFETSAVEGLKKNNDSSKKPVKLCHMPNVLIVDDNKVNLELAAEMLRNAGCQVTTANSGEKAISQCRKHFFDVILMDIQMPDMDGVEASSKIKEGCLHAAPIIAMTAYSIHGDKKKILNAGLDDFIAKPINPDVLFKKIAKWTGKTSNGLLSEGIESTNEKLLDINLVTLEKLRKHTGSEVLFEVLNSFDQECQTQIKTCKKLFKEKKIENILNILHTLKGNASTLGVEKMAQKAEFLEYRLKNKKYHNFEKDLAKLETLHKGFLKEVEKFDRLNIKN